jgi:TetR/AcrR family transcriptional regulator
MATWKDSVPSRIALHDAKREALLREAASAFNRQGFHATSLEDIARNLGVSKAALYHYFPNKQVLLRECFDTAMQVAFASFEAAKREGRNGREKLRLTVSGYLEQMIDELSCGVVPLEDTALLPEDRDQLVRERDRFEQGLRTLVREGIADGSIVPCDPKLVVFTILGALNWVPKWFRHNGAWSPAGVASAMTELFDRALSTKPTRTLTEKVGSQAGSVESRKNKQRR